MTQKVLILLSRCNITRSYRAPYPFWYVKQTWMQFLWWHRCVTCHASAPTRTQFFIHLITISRLTFNETRLQGKRILQTNSSSGIIYLRLRKTKMSDWECCRQRGHGRKLRTHTTFFSALNPGASRTKRNFNRIRLALWTGAEYKSPIKTQSTHGRISRAINYLFHLITTRRSYKWHKSMGGADPASWLIDQIHK